MEEKKVNSRWQINRIGLVDFWYYDEEEFYFLDGRMLLRGSNGSGKSVTMQSFIPLLLDGNMRPERLDPFGSNARKMKNYLLEENDEREERTGYLYMEFKRIEADQYITIGIGMRARKNKELDTWYFCILDGRRANKDFPLYKDGKAKLSLTKQELKNRIGDGGKVLETQKEYMEMVNKQIFGFDTIEEYKEMIDLLIQLRTPKLSKDFKPSILNEILGNSLAPLSEDDLRPMSEAIENMDNLKYELESLKTSIVAANRIKREYEKYNQAVLYNTANQYSIAWKECDKLNDEYSKIIIQLGELERDLYLAKTTLDSIKTEEKILNDKKDSLNASDLKKLVNEKQDLETEYNNTKKEWEEKEEGYNSKKNRELDYQNKQKDEENKLYECQQKMRECLDDLITYNELLDIQELTFMSRDILESPKKLYDYESHRAEVTRLEKQIEEGKYKLEELEQVRRNYDEILQLLEQKRIERDTCEMQSKQADNQLTEVKSELVEHIQQWNKNNKFLKLQSIILQQIEGTIQSFTSNEDYDDIYKLVHAEYYLLQNGMKNELFQVNRNIEEVDQKIKDANNELYEWEHKTEPEPECDEEVTENRKRLTEAGIPHTPLYRVIDFAENISEERQNYLEEALLRMGILNALIVPKEYRDQVLSMRRGCCDCYLFGNETEAQNNLQSLLEIDCGEENIIKTISNILASISLEPQYPVSIQKDGNYQLGILTGTITGTYQAKFIGRNAREQYRKERIEDIQNVIYELMGQKEQLSMVCKDVEEKLSMLDEEKNEFPNDIDLRTALKELDKSIRNLENSQEEVGRFVKKEEIEREKYRNVRNEAQEIANSVNLPVKMESFKEALQDCKDYIKTLYELELHHSSFMNIATGIDRTKEDIISIQEDIDEIHHTISKLSDKSKYLMNKIQSLDEQLKISGFEELQEELERCIKRLKELPDERDEATRKHQDLQNRIDGATKRKQHLILDIEKMKESVVKKQVVFYKELNLNYVFQSNQLENLTTQQCAAFCLKEMNDELLDKTGTYLNALQDKFHENKSSLNDYFLSLEEVDKAESQGNSETSRYDIIAKYQYIKVSFLDLVQHMEAAKEEKELILSEKDRELFEDILANTVSRKIRSKIFKSDSWVQKMNKLMENMNTSSGLSLSLKWKPKRAEQEGQLDTKKLVELLKQDTEIMRPEDFAKLSSHFRSKIAESKRLLEQKENVKSFHAIVKEVLDYRKWFEFTLECKKTGEAKKELTNRVFFTFSGGEKAMSMYVPLFSAVVSKYDSARQDAPRLISLDEAFAGVDEMNIKDMFRLMVECDFNFIINSQILYGDYETVPSLAIYQLVRPKNEKFVTVISYIWNGKQRELVQSIGEKIE